MLKFIYLSIIYTGSCEYAVSIAIKFYSECINMLEAKLMQFQTKLKVYYSSITYITCEIVKHRIMKSSIHWKEAFLIFWPNRISKKNKDYQKHIWSQTFQQAASRKHFGHHQRKGTCANSSNSNVRHARAWVLLGISAFMVKDRGS